MGAIEKSVSNKSGGTLKAGARPGEVRAVLHLKRNAVEGFAPASVFPFKVLPRHGEFLDVVDGGQWVTFSVESIRHADGVSAPQIFATIKAPKGQRLNLN